jgi:hypothetical protein
MRTTQTSLKARLRPAKGCQAEILERRGPRSQDDLVAPRGERSMTCSKPTPLGPQILEKRGPQSQDDIAAPHGKRSMTRSKPTSLGPQILKRRGPRSQDDLTASHGERSMTRSKPTSLDPQIYPQLSSSRPNKTSHGVVRSQKEKTLKVSFENHDCKAHAAQPYPKKGRVPNRPWPRCSGGKAQGHQTTLFPHITRGP